MKAEFESLVACKDLPPAELEEFLRIAAKIDPRQPLGRRVHDALCRITPSSSAEVGVWRPTKDVGIEIFLRLREDGESYAGQWHCAGSCLRVSDFPSAPGIIYTNHYRAAVERAVREYAADGIAECVEVIGSGHAYMEERGAFDGINYAVRVIGDRVGLELGPKANWFRSNALPKPMVWHHETQVIPTILEHLRGRGYAV